MAKKKTANETAKELFEKIQGIKLNEAAGIYGETAKGSLRHNLPKTLAALNSAMGENRPYDEIMAAFEEFASAFDAAAITGIISEAEIPGYYKLIDDLWATIESEKNK